RAGTAGRAGETRARAEHATTAARARRAEPPPVDTLPAVAAPREPTPSSPPAAAPVPPVIPPPVAAPIPLPAASPTPSVETPPARCRATRRGPERASPRPRDGAERPARRRTRDAHRYPRRRKRSAPRCRRVIAGAGATGRGPGGRRRAARVRGLPGALPRARGR